MSFHILRRHRAVVFPPDRVAVSIYRSRAPDRIVSRSRLCIAMYPKVLTAMGWRERDRITVVVGAGDDAGKIRLRLNGGEGRVLSRPNRQARRLQLICATWPGLPELARATAVTWRQADPGELEIDLPDAWRRDGEQ